MPLVATCCRRWKGVDEDGRNCIRRRKVCIAQAAGVPFALVDSFSKRLPVPEEALERIHIAMEENWWE